MYIDMSLREYIGETAGPKSAPGGGSVAALVASLGLGLTEMANHFTRDKEAYRNLPQDLREEMEAKIGRLEEIRLGLMELIDRDSQAFQAVLEAYRLDREDPRRDQALEAGYKEALAVPWQVFQSCLEALRLEEVFSRHSSKNIISDVGIGSLLSYAGLEASVINIEINLAQIRDQAYEEALRQDLACGQEEARDLRDRIMKNVRERI